MAPEYGNLLILCLATRNLAISFQSEYLIFLRVNLHFIAFKFGGIFLKNLLKMIVSFARERRKRLCHERVSLTNRLIELKCQLVQGFSLVSAEIIFIESQLAALADRYADGVKIRSRTQWLEEGEKPSRFFFKLERECIQRNFVKSIFDPDGKEVFTHEEIENAHVHFYTNLFSAKK